ncbi:hypothetical protein [Elioraea rosea]|uniref:hypothetical protein n=1 Tax=Elioraea rosea TaxID=2492390 RepID=UPI00118429E9|nr:hypothetical protein [Elioraea rosea]
MVSGLFQVLVHAELPSLFGARARWFLAANHADLSGAEASFRALDLDLPSSSVSIVVVRREHDPATGTLVDRVVKARGAVPPIERGQMDDLDDAMRAELAGIDRDVAPTVLATRFPWLAGLIGTGA